MGWGDTLYSWWLRRLITFRDFLDERPYLWVFFPGFVLLKVLPEEVGGRETPLFDALRSVPGLHTATLEAMEQVEDFAEKTWLPINEYVSLLTLPFLIQSYLSAGAAAASFPVAREVKSARPDPNTAWRTHFVSEVSRSKVVSALKDQGWDDEWIEGFEDFASAHTDVNTAMELYRRGEIDLVAFYARLTKLGFTSEGMKDLDKLKDLIPGPADLITMAVREAWRDDVARKYGLDQDYVDDFGFWMKKQGYSEDWSKKWWRAHWRLPGIQQAQEMLWRTDMTEDDFAEFLRFSDVPDTWRQWLGEIAYRTLTRVDVRRMHATETLDDDDVLQAYLDFGYNRENALRMTDFTIKYNAGSDKELTKADILKGYAKGAFTRDEALGALEGLGYPTATANYYLSMEDYHVVEELAGLEIGIVQTLYTTGEIDQVTARGRLSALGLASRRMDLLFEKWNVTRGAKVGQPTKGELETFIKQGLIGEAAYREQMAMRGFPADYVNLYYSSIVLEQEATARTEAERAAKEAERIRLAAEKTVYQEAKAEIDYQIAETRLHYQQLKTAVTLYARREDVDELMASIEELQRDIARVGVSIAAKQTEIRTAKAALRELGVPPDLSILYDLMDELNLQITEREAEIGDMRVGVAEGTAGIRAARLPAELTELHDRVLELRSQIAQEQEVIAGLRVGVAEAQLEIERLGVPEEVLSLYRLVDQIQVSIAEERAAIADLKVELAEAVIAARWEAPATDVESHRRIIDALEIAVRVDQEQVARFKLEIAEIKAQVERLLSTEEIAQLEEAMAEAQERLRELEIDRARLRL